MSRRIRRKFRPMRNLDSMASERQRGLRREGALLKAATLKNVFSRSSVRSAGRPVQRRAVKFIQLGNPVEQSHRRVDGDVAVKFEQWRLIRLVASGRDVQRFERAHGITHQRLVAQAVRIQLVQAAINLGEGHVQVVAIHRQIRRQRGGRGVFHELGVERAADAPRRRSHFYKPARPAPARAAASR